MNIMCDRIKLVTGVHHCHSNSQGERKGGKEEKITGQNNNNKKHVLVTVLHRLAYPVAGHEHKIARQRGECEPNSEKQCPQILLDRISIGQSTPSGQARPSHYVSARLVLMPLLLAGPPYTAYTAYTDSTTGLVDVYNVSFQTFDMQK